MGKLLQLGLEALRLEMGMIGHLFAKDWIALRHLATPLWLTHTRQFQHEHQILVETTTLEIFLTQENDLLIMEAIHQVGIIGK